MAAFVKQGFRVPNAFGWFDKLETLLARELAPSPRKLRTALRLATMGATGAGLIASCHVNSELGTYIVWLLVGAGPMMSLSRAVRFLIAQALALIASVVMARLLAETPWLLLPFLFVLFSGSTYLGTIWKLGAYLLLIQVVSLNVFYGVIFAPENIGWDAAGEFGGSAIAFAVVVLFDNWVWPDPGEALLREALGASVARARLRLLAAAQYYLHPEAARRPPLPPPTSDLPMHMALLDQAVAERISDHRHAVLLAAVTRVARIYLEVDRLIVEVRENVPREIRALVQPEIETAVEAIAAALDEFAQELPADIPVGVDEPPPASRTQARLAMDNLDARMIQVRPAYIGKASSSEIENFASFHDSLAALTEHIERLLDEPPLASAVTSSKTPVPRLTDPPDPATVRYSLKVGLCAVAGYIVGATSQRPDLSTILTTVLITALPTYGAVQRKMILRIVGALLGGVVSLLTIILVTPNFVTLPAYLIAVFLVFYVSGYSSLSSGRLAYAAKQIGTTFAIVFAGLSPSVDIYEPLWRIWGILLGTLVVAVVFFILWPEYAGDALFPRLRRVLQQTLALVPGGSATNTEHEILQANSQTMRILAEILSVADDAQVEGRASLVDHHSIVEAAGMLRRIANRLSSIATERIVAQPPPLDPPTESARDEFFAVNRAQLQSWLAFFSGAQYFSAPAAQAIAHAHLPEDLGRPLKQFSSRLGEQDFAQIGSWTLARRRAILSELHSMRRLEFLFSELDRWLAQILGPAANPAIRFGHLIASEDSA
jgi:hypothetical protein